MSSSSHPRFLLEPSISLCPLPFHDLLLLPPSPQWWFTPSASRWTERSQCLVAMITFKLAPSHNTSWFIRPSELNWDAHVQISLIKELLSRMMGNVQFISNEFYLPSLLFHQLYMNMLPLPYHHMWTFGLNFSLPHFITLDINIAGCLKVQRQWERMWESTRM